MFIVVIVIIIESNVALHLEWLLALFWANLHKKKKLKKNSSPEVVVIFNLCVSDTNDILTTTPDDLLQ